MVKLTINMTVDSVERDVFLDTVKGLPNRIRVEEGCLDCRMTEVDGQENAFSLVQEWRDRDALQQHGDGHNYSNLMIALEMLSEPPRISLDLGEAPIELDSVMDLVKY